MRGGDTARSGAARDARTGSMRLPPHETAQKAVSSSPISSPMDSAAIHGYCPNGAGGGRGARVGMAEGVACEVVARWRILRSD